MSLRPSLSTVRRRGINGRWRMPGSCRVINPEGRNDQLASEIAKFLHTNEDIPKIDFHLGISEKRIHITGAKIANIGTHLQAGELKVKIVKNKLLGDAGARYRRKERKFLFRSWIAFSKEELEAMPEQMAKAVRGSLFRGDALTCGLVVHEAVHAALGLEDRAIVRLSDEAAAYLAETLFHVYRTTYPFYLSHAGNEPHRQIIETARELITEHRLDSSPGRHLNWLEYRALRKVIHADPLYEDLGPIERYD
jgi:hypothetical protein